MSYTGKTPVDYVDIMESQSLVVLNDLTVDTNTLYVDSTNNLVGIGTSSPASALDVTGTVTADGGAFAGNVTFGENNKAIFGANNDLEILHDGTNSVIRDTGIGDLSLSTNGSKIEFYDQTNNQFFAEAFTGAGFKLYYDGSQKFVTQPNGIDVTGTVTADGVEVDGLLHIDGSDNANVASISLTRTDASWSLDNETNFRIYGNTGDTTNPATKRMEIAINGDISFFEDTGTTAKLFWDASAESLGIGTTSTGTYALVVDSQSKGVSDAEAGIYSKATRNGVTWNLVSNNTYTGTDTGAGIKFTSGDFNTGGIIVRADGTASSGDAAGYMTFHISNNASEDLAERMRIDGSGNVLVGKTSLDGNTAGFQVEPAGAIAVTRSGSVTAYFNRQTSDGDIAVFRKDGTTVGSISNISTTIYVGSGDTNLRFNRTASDIRPVFSTGLNRDNVIDLGDGSARFDDIFATNGTIQTSDANEKQQIASLTDAEIAAAKTISSLFKTFKWNDKVEAKGDAARTHTGVIAQDVQQAMTDAGLDAGNYAFFISTTWWEAQTEVPAVEAVEAQDAVYDEDGNIVTEAVEAVEAKDAYTRTDTYETAEEAPEGATERTRLGIRYPELLAFVGAATEQRLSNIEARLATLETN